ncbi:MAG: hypothetical protein R6U96_18810 [Promethearchaeia archaeon]
MPKKRKKRDELAHNPKLSEDNKDKKRATKKPSYKDEYYEYEKSYTKYYMIAIFIGLLVVILVIYSTVYNAPGPRVEQYDGVKLNYEIYTVDQYDNQEDPTIEEINTWVNACASNTDDTCENGVFESFYKKLLGKREGDVCNYEPIEDCECENYGDLDGEDVVLWFKVLEINKTAQTTELESSFCSTYLSPFLGIVPGVFIYQYLPLRKTE